MYFKIRQIYKLGFQAMMVKEYILNIKITHNVGEKGSVQSNM